MTAMIILGFLFDASLPALFILIIALCAGAISNPVPVAPVRALCLLFWSAMVFWFWGVRPEISWLMAYEFGFLLCCGIACVVLWTVTSSQANKPHAEKTLPEPMHFTPIKASAEYQSEITLEEDLLRNKYRGS